jgi:hypothetical protein
MEGKIGLNGVGFAVEFSELVRNEIARLSFGSEIEVLRFERELVEASFTPTTAYSSKLEVEMGQQLVVKLVSDLDKNNSQTEIVQTATYFRGVSKQFLESTSRCYGVGSPEFRAAKGQVIAGLKKIESLRPLSR